MMSVTGFGLQNHGKEPHSHVVTLKVSLSLDEQIQRILKLSIEDLLLIDKT